MSDCTWLAKDIRDCCNKAGEPLSEEQFLLIAGYTAALATTLGDSEHSKNNIQPESEKRRAPFPDFEGNPIHEGDTMRRPDGTIGRVYYFDSVQSFDTNYGAILVTKEWCIKWFGSGTLAPLKDGLDNEVQAVVVK